MVKERSPRWTFGEFWTAGSTGIAHTVQFILELLRDLMAPILCPLGSHRYFTTETGVPRQELEAGRWLPLHGQGKPCRRCFFCEKEVLL